MEELHIFLYIGVVFIVGEGVPSARWGAGGGGVLVWSVGKRVKVKGC